MPSATDNEIAPLLTQLPPRPPRHSPDTTLPVVTATAPAAHLSADFAPDDPDNPLEWKSTFKWFNVFLLAISAFTVTFSCVCIVPVARRISRSLGADAHDTWSGVVLVTIWELGEATGPLLIGSLSEVFGRSPVINVANALFVATLCMAVVAPNLGFLILARALTGAAVAVNVLGPAIVGDIFVPEQRGTAMSTILFAPLLGSAVGPAFSGAAIESLSWRLIILICAALSALAYTVFYLLFDETYKPVILRRRAAAAAAAARLVAAAAPCPSSSSNAADKQPYSRHQNMYRLLWLSISRPFAILASSGVLMAVSLFIAIVFSHLYVSSITMPRIIEDVYRLSPTAAGLSFFSTALGSLIGIMACKSWLDAIYVLLRDKNKGVGLPEFRLPIAIFGASIIVPGVALYGWCAEYGWNIYVFLFSCVWTRMALIMTFAPMTAYVVDACGLYSASALTAVIAIRCLAAAVLPLVTDAMINRLGYGLGFSIYALVTLVFVSIPLVLYYKGERWRLRSEYTQVEEVVDN